jgi:capsule polysaccharide export protein KpsE/RkpR
MKEVLHCWETVVATWSNKVEGWDVHIDHLRLLLKYTDNVSEICQSRVDSSKTIESRSISECIVEACRRFLNSLQQKHVQRITGMCQDEWNVWYENVDLA